MVLPHQLPELVGIGQISYGRVGAKLATTSGMPRKPAEQVASHFAHNGCLFIAAHRRLGINKPVEG
jgi:hypothetical protein